MSTHQLDEERIFHLAREIPGVSARSEYLNQVCAGDQALRERVEELLRVHEQEQSFLKSGGAPPPTEAMGELNIASGQQIGRYKLLQKIGEGGFGVVFMAEQSRPVRRKVALKVIKPGMDTQTVIARFEAERQALAMMDHSNIARVFDGGASESGRPYFVMELVKGVPITEYCDQNELSTEQRLKLFITVCQALQHAHQKGIIHRDLKPSNVLVTLADGEPVVKVIDFGVAKATSQQLTEKTLFTAFGQMVGTPQYMSPEQAEMSCLDVDTRSDVYSLGVLLYELLTGTTPLEAERLRAAGYAEMQRLIREEEPPKPSTRLSTSGEKLTILAKHRKVTPEKLKSQVKGDLDWIVMKALEKDRNRRYESPSGLAGDVVNYLENEPVDARPPTVGYRVWKYSRRNRLPILVAALLVASLGTGLVGTIWQRMQLINTLQDSHELLVERCFLQGIGGEFEEARKTWDLAQRAGVRADWLRTMKGAIAFHQGDWPSAIAELESALALNPGNISAKALLSNAFVYNGQQNEWAQIADDLEHATPGTEYATFDRLFLGYAYFYIDYQRAADSIQSVIRDHPSWLIPRYVWAGANAHQARRLKGMKPNEAKDLIRKALAEVKPSLGLEAEAGSLETPYVTAIKLYVYDMAYDLLRESSQDELATIANEGDRLARKLDQWPEYAIGGLLREWHYGLVPGDDRPIQLKQVRESILKHGRGFLLNGPIAELAMAGKYQSILALEDRGPEVEFYKAVVRIIRNEGDDRVLALKTYRTMKEEYPTWYMRSLLLEIPLLAGNVALAQRDAERWLTEMPTSEASGLASATRCERERLSRIATADIRNPYPFKDEPYHDYQKQLLEGICAFGQGDWSAAAALLRELVNEKGRVSNRYYWAEVLLSHAEIQLLQQDGNMEGA